MKKFFNVFICFLTIHWCFGQSQNYLVLTSISDTNDTYYQAAVLLKNFRNGSILIFSPNNLPVLQSQLTQIKPRYVALVMRPQEIDINFVRRFFYA